MRIGEQVANGERLELVALLLHVRAQAVQLFLRTDLALGAVSLEIRAQSGDLRAGRVLGLLDALGHARPELVLAFGGSTLHVDGEVFLEHHALLGDDLGDHRVAEREVGDGLVSLRLLDAGVEIGGGLAEFGNPVLEFFLEAGPLSGKLGLAFGDACFDLGALVGAS